jgi:hypothetical protein
MILLTAFPIDFNYNGGEGRHEGVAVMASSGRFLFGFYSLLFHKKD